jgi:hypothetical protein
MNSKSITIYKHVLIDDVVVGRKPRYQFVALSPFSTRRICLREAKGKKSWQCDWSAKKIAAKKLDH